jgi:hypothetical protein
MQRLEAQQRERRIKLMESTVEQKDGTRVRPLQAISQTQLLNQSNNCGICPKEVVIKFLQPGVTNPKAGGQATCGRLLFKDRHLVTRLREPIGGAQPQCAAAKYCILHSTPHLYCR